MQKEEFAMQKKLLELGAKNEEKKHKFHMKEFEEQKNIEMLKFGHAKELQRIKSAEIRKSIERRQNLEFMKTYPKNARYSY